MKVLYISWSDYYGAGGTSVALNLLHTRLKKIGVESKILCNVKTVDSPDSLVIRRSRILEKLIKEITVPLGFNDLHGVSSFGIARHPAFMEADLVHFHSLHASYFNFLALPYLTKKKPALWTLHDVWALTGHCAIFYDCLRWKTGCGHCPHLNKYPVVRRDATHWEWRLKKWAYEKSKVSLVVASRWFESLLKDSILSGHPVYRIPWGIDTEIYKSLDKNHCRSVLGIPEAKKVILFVAMNLADKRKGSDLLIQALKQMPESLKKETVLLTMGNGAEEFFRQIDIRYIHLGWVFSDQFKAIAYSAADVFVSPTRAETFGLTLAESMACGTPVVSFAIGPVPELVRHGVTGYAALPESADDLSAGILRFLEDRTYRESLGRNGRQMVENEYTLDLEIRRYAELYKKILG